MIELYNLCYLHVHCITCIIILFNKSFWTVISGTKSQSSHIHGENEECQMMHNVFVHILTPQLLKSIDKWQRYSHFVAFWTDFRHLSLYHKITGWTQLKCKQHKKPWGRRTYSLAPDCFRLPSSLNKQSRKYNQMDPILIGTAVSEHIIMEMIKPSCTSGQSAVFINIHDTPWIRDK